MLEIQSLRQHIFPFNSTPQTLTGNNRVRNELTNNWMIVLTLISCFQGKQTELIKLDHF